MSFSDALGYPFRGENIPKILSIILVFLIVVTAFFVVAMLFESANIIFAVIPIFLAYGVFIGGYMVSVIRSIAEGEILLPQPDLGRDLGRGIVIVVAGIVHAIPFIVLYLCAVAIFGAAFASSFSSSGSSDGGGGIFMICGLVLVMIGLGFVIGHTFIVGLIRYAMEDSAGALFDFGNNFSTVTSNIGTVFGLFVRIIGLGIIYGIIGYVVGFAFGLAIGGITEFNLYAVVVLVIYYLAVLTLNLMNQISQAHLYAGFGQELGLITYGKSKNMPDAEPYSFSS